MHEKIIIITLCMLLIPSSAYAISLGSTQKITFAEVSPLDSAKFSMLFWNTDNQTYSVSLTTQEYPEGWSVIISSPEFFLNRDSGDENIVLPYMQDSVMAKNVDIYVKPGEKSPPGAYRIVVKSETRLPEIKTSGMNVISERLYVFDVNITGIITTSSQSQDRRVVYDYGNSSQPKDRLSSESKTDDKTLFYLMVVIFVLASSIIIYKKYK
jgi:hypothetical protein